MATAKPSGDERKYRDLPMLDLLPSAKRILSLHLNVKSELPSSSGLPPDVSGVAELRGFINLHIESFLRSADPTEAMLREWNNYGLGVRDDSVQSLLDILAHLDRRDVLSALEPSLEASLRTREEHRAWQDSLLERPTQDPTVSSVDGSDSDHHIDERSMLCVYDTHTQKAYFDVFISYTRDDFQFAKDLVTKLESEPHQIKCFFMDRDGLVGGSRNTVDALLIKERCQKFIVLISRKFLESPVCEFQVRFAQYLSPGAHSRKVIPILLEEGVRGPDILHPISALDYTRVDLRDWFWNRLVRTIRAVPPPSSRSENDSPELVNLKLTITATTEQVSQTTPTASDTTAATYRRL